MTADELASMVTNEAAKEMASALSRIKHCVGQLDDAQIWWRPHPSLNSIGNLILHLSGNLRQWIVAGLGATADTRNRPAEFSERGPILKAELLSKIETVVEEACAVLTQQNALQMVEVRRIQGFQRSGIAAIFDSVPHFRGHTQEIIVMTRMQLGDGYQFQWQPLTPEQGSPIERKPTA